MFLIDKNEIDFTTIETYEYGSEPMDIAFKEDIEEIPRVKAIPIDRIKQAKKEIKYLTLHKAQFITNDYKVCIDSAEVLEILDKLIESEE